MHRAPKGNLAAGDVMLAQKIALEEFENEALATQTEAAATRRALADGL
jgi:hypothetical protein